MLALHPVENRAGLAGLPVGATVRHDQDFAALKAGGESLKYRLAEQRRKRRLDRDFVIAGQNANGKPDRALGAWVRHGTVRRDQQRRGSISAAGGRSEWVMTYGTGGTHPMQQRALCP